jgi:dihydroxyacetone kinase
MGGGSGHGRNYAGQRSVRKALTIRPSSSPYPDFAAIAAATAACTVTESKGFCNNASA